MGSWTGTVPSQAVGKVRAADIQTMDDILTALTASWTDYIPVWGGLTIANATVIAKYRIVGKTGDVRVRAIMGSGTTYGASFISVSLPFTVLDLGNVGAGYIFDSGVGQRPGTVFPLTTTTVVMTVGTAVVSTPGTPITWSTGDEFAFTCAAWEIA